MSIILDPHRRLPCRADRQKIIDQAEFVLAKALVIVEQSDQVFAWVSAKRPAAYLVTAISSPV
jgi:hypothetical protein